MSSSLRHHRDVRMHDPPSASTNGAPLVSPAIAPASSATNGPLAPSSVIQKLNSANEQTWLLIGRVAEQMGDLEHALSAYENALRHNPMSLSGLTQVAGIARIKENYPKAIEFFQRVLSLQEDNGEVWSALGHCYLMQDDLQKAYAAYQQALYLLPNPKEDPKLWYGIGILYDRYGSLDHAEEAFSSVLAMDKDLDFDKANEILFRLGIIYKQQGKYDDSLACFDRILRNPPSPLAHADIWFQIGHVYEQQKDHVQAKDAYERVVADNPVHAKVLQQLGWLYHQDGSSFQNQELAIQYLTKSLEADSSDAQSWYLLGRAYMAGQKYNKAYEAYQQAVYRDGRNPTFWCSIGVLYFQINQFRDALDAYSRAIRINPYISEVWFDLGSFELDPGNVVISNRLQLLKTAQATGGQLPAAPGPQDVHPTAYASAVVPPPGLTGPPLLLQPPNQRTSFRLESRNTPNEISLPPPSQGLSTRSPPGPFRGGPPPPPQWNWMAMAEIFSPVVKAVLVLVLLVLSSFIILQIKALLMTFELAHRTQIISLVIVLLPLDPLPRLFLLSELGHLRHLHPHIQTFHLQPAPLVQANPCLLVHLVRTLHSHRVDPSTKALGTGVPVNTGSPVQIVGLQGTAMIIPNPLHFTHRALRDIIPIAVTVLPNHLPGHRVLLRDTGIVWETDRLIPRGRFDPTREPDVRTAGHPSSRVAALPPVVRSSESPHPANDKEKRRRAPASREPEPTPTPTPLDNSAKKDKEKKKRTSSKRKDDEFSKGYSTGSGPGGYKSTSGYSKGGSPGPTSSNGSGSSNRPSPTSAMTPRPPSRVVDEDYDEGVADALMGLAAYRPPPAEGSSESHSHSPTISSGSRHSDSRPSVSHRDSISSNRSHMSPPPQPMKRALSPVPDDSNDNKRSRIDSVKRRASSPSNGRRTPVPSTRPSPIPFRTQPTSHSPDSVRHEAYPPSPPLPAVLPPHPRPIGAGAGVGITQPSSSASIALPPIATLSPTSSAPSPGAGNDERERDRDRDRMQQIPPKAYPLTRIKWG
ncbi:transcriptional corepressor [Lentinula edodes]|uniref:Transcriptional corepressor n=1 Tax=Lentinula edodes TaxID=5353 RepID=A0A1Q3ECV2_LENED|nr:transcriptional corepressor [Lentinula edodes]